ncbi:ribosome silencing factor [Lutimonas zeaxanthinifaciens]|uniref:ribosome silencing factor n=1 Tax=Lutimonas zeaxanthinifaciens TaxID=3060215 RepID=UPI00265CE566|nr:ribosome silencing factor [Lutimonas sp. YSD2104]WKK64965.1 ribosome silencing factor [Lutimonas sp. YSD2104]
MAKKIVSSDLLITEVIKGIEDVKGENISIIDLREIENTVCEYFILCDGTSNTQVSAIAASVQKNVSKSLKDKPWHVEGESNAEWILIDYVNVVVHVFQKHVREFYKLEELWGDGKITNIENAY